MSNPEWDNYNPRNIVIFRRLKEDKEDRNLIVLDIGTITFLKSAIGLEEGDNVKVDLTILNKEGE